MTRVTQEWSDREIQILRENVDEPTLATLQKVNEFRESRGLSKRTRKSVIEKRYKLGLRSSFYEKRLVPQVVTEVPKLVLDIPKYRGLVVKPKLMKKMLSDEDGFLTISDLHVGVLDEHGASNSAVVREKLMMMARNTLHVLTNHNRVDLLHVCFLGDIVTGQENYQFQITEVAPITQQQKDAIEILYDFMVYLLDGLHVLGIGADVYAVAGNHGKTSQYRNPEQDNVDMLVYDLLRKIMRFRYPWLKFEFDVRRLVVQIQGQNVVLEHGDKIRSYINVPLTGWERRSNRLQGMENLIIGIYMIGHHHGFGQWFLNRTILMMSGTLHTNGSLGDAIGLLPEEKFWLFSLSHGKLGFQYAIDLREQENSNLPPKQGAERLNRRETVPNTSSHVASRG